jgi:hypothetical protein
VVDIDALTTVRELCMQLGELGHKPGWTLFQAITASNHCIDSAHRSIVILIVDVAFMFLSSFSMP